MSRALDGTSTSLLGDGASISGDEGHSFQTWVFSSRWQLRWPDSQRNHNDQVDQADTKGLR